MAMTTGRRSAIEVTAAAVAVFVAALLPWGAVDFRRAPAPLGPPFGDAFNQMFQAVGTVPVTAWNGHARVAGVNLPNALVLICGAALAVLSWLSAAAVWVPPAWLPIALAGYGLAHGGYVLVGLAVSEEGSMGVGVVLTVAAFAWMLVAVVRQRRAARPAGRRPRRRDAVPELAVVFVDFPPASAVREILGYHPAASDERQREFTMSQ
jgi:hypothetical protein